MRRCSFVTLVLAATAVIICVHCPSNVRAASLAHISPLEMLSSVMGPPISMPTTMGGALDRYLVAGMPWVESPVNATSPPTRRTVTFLPVESGQPMCAVDVRRSSASCVALADAGLIPVLAGVETSIVDPAAPVLIASKATLALVARDGTTLASFNLSAPLFRNLTHLGVVWHVDFNASSGTATVYHHNSTALFADVLSVTGSSFGEKVFRIVYFSSGLAFIGLMPNRLIDAFPCHVEAAGAPQGEPLQSTWSLRSASVLSTSRCIATIPAAPSRADRCLSSAASGLCNVNVAAVGPDGSVGAYAAIPKQSCCWNRLEANDCDSGTNSGSCTPAYSALHR